MEFNAFRDAVAKQFARMQKYPLFRVDLDRHTLYSAYQEAFPAGTNEIYRERREHDCTCCNSFISALGNVVAIIDDKIISIWGVGEIANEPEYSAVAAKLNALVRSKRIRDRFFHWNNKAGEMQSIEDLLETSKVRGEPLKKGAPTTITWNHFHANIASKFVLSESDIPSAMAVTRDRQHVFARGLKEITDEAVSTMLDLIADEALYRGEEHKYAVEKFDELRLQAKDMTDEQFEVFTWKMAISDLSDAVICIRNKSTGTLLKDLTEGMDIEEACKRFDKVMAPTNYKRPTGAVSAAMLKRAQAKVEELGLTSALHRRYATIDDITVNNVLFKNGSAKKPINGSVFDDVAPTASQTKDYSKVQEISIDRFLSEVVPRAQSIEVLLENRHQSNMVSLTTQVDATAGQLFKWNNSFAWSYQGGMADAIKERVKAAGGAVEGDLCCRLAWEYTDDLDFYMREPDGYTIHFSNRRRPSPNGGVLDLDANGCDGQRDDPAENIVYADRNRMREGQYTLWVNNYCRRSNGVGFEVEVEFDGTRHNFVYEKALRSGENVQVATIKYTKKDGFEIVKSMGGTTSAGPSKNLWGLNTNDFHKVNIALLSPNYWDGHGVGHKHYFFMLEGCKSADAPRVFNNEFLIEALTPHRRVFELLGSQLKVPESDGQLSGLGFSSTVRNSFVVRVTGSVRRILRVTV